MSNTIFSRRELATQMAEQILHPTPLTEIFHSGLFLSGLRRIGKTTFIKHDLIPALEQLGAIVIYVDLWSDVKANPRQLVMAAIQKELTELQTPASSLARKLAGIRGIDVDALGFKFGINLAAVGSEGGPSLLDAMLEVIDTARTHVVLIVDEVQQAITTEEGHNLLLALKAVRDAVNIRPLTPGKFIFIGTGSHRAMVGELVARRNQAFQGAHSMEFPVLGADYVSHVLGLLSESGVTGLPRLDVALSAFQTLGCRPEEFKKALIQLVQNRSPELPTDIALPLIAATLRGAAADVEIRRLEDLGELAVAIFDKIASSEEAQRGLFSAEAAADYTNQLGRTVQIGELQPVVNAMLDENLIMRRGHGVYTVTDPFVKTVWQERKRLS
jgi:hypothetical protein